MNDLYLQENDKSRERFERQRRNLILISIVLTIFYLLGFEIKELNFFGNGIELKSADRFDVALWLIWSYFLIRYLQYYLVVNHHEFKGVYHTSVEQYLKDVAKKRFTIESFPGDLVMSPLGERGEIHKLDVEVTHTSTRVAKFLISGSVQFLDGGDVDEESFRDKIYQLDGFPLLRARSISWFKLTLFTPNFTEYYFPVFLALTPLIA